MHALFNVDCKSVPGDLNFLFVPDPYPGKDDSFICSLVHLECYLREIWLGSPDSPMIHIYKKMLDLCTAAIIAKKDSGMRLESLVALALLGRLASGCCDEVLVKSEWLPSDKSSTQPNVVCNPYDVYDKDDKGGTTKVRKFFEDRKMWPKVKEGLSLFDKPAIVFLCFGTSLFEVYDFVVGIENVAKGHTDMKYIGYQVKESKSQPKKGHSSGTGYVYFTNVPVTDEEVPTWTSVDSDQMDHFLGALYHLLPERLDELTGIHNATIAP